MNKNTIPLIIIVIVIICFGLGGLGLVIHNIKNDEKHLGLRLEQMEKDDLPDDSMPDPDAETIHPFEGLE